MLGIAAKTLAQIQDKAVQADIISSKNEEELP